MTREQWNEHSERIAKEVRAFEREFGDTDWQPENIGIYITSLRNEAEALEELTNFYNQENKGAK